MHNMSSLVDEFLSIDGIVIFEPVLSNGHIHLCLFISIDGSVWIIEIDFLQYFGGSVIIFFRSIYFSDLLLDIRVLEEIIIDSLTSSSNAICLLALMLSMAYRPTSRALSRLSFLSSSFANQEITGLLTVVGTSSLSTTDDYLQSLLTVIDD